MAIKTAVRLNKYLSLQGVASRRKADLLIQKGQVKINGDIVKTPWYQVTKTDKVQVAGHILQKLPPKLEYLILNKPKGVISTAADPQKRPTVVGLIGASTRLYPVGRLDQDSEGLVILTNDGQLAYRLTHPKYHVPKIYQVTITGRIKASALNRMRTGVRLEDGLTAPAEVEIVNQTGQSTNLSITLFEGKKRQIRRMSAVLGLNLTHLKRLSIGPVNLNNLPSGQFRPLTTAEVASLKKAASLDS
ncbi:rRNA pseudouridine synthase [Candidatus Collierbacteria bacterium]|nr:rRNA pseudouridine synthase [Candidatus Collierbacteria bacterium]